MSKIYKIGDTMLGILVVLLLGFGTGAVVDNQYDGKVGKFIVTAGQGDETQDAKH